MKDLSIFQTIIYIGIIIRTKTPCPRVFVSLVTDDVLRADVNSESMLFYFHDKVIWPGRINVDGNGTVQIQFNKLVHANWPFPFATPSRNKSFTLPPKWTMEVIANEPIGNMISLLSLAYISRIYHYTYPTDRYQLVVRFEDYDKLYWFVPVPMLPLRDLYYPNAAPGMWRSLGESMQIIANAQPLYSISNFLSRKKIGSVLYVTGPFENFCPWDLENKYKFYFVSTTTGLRHLLGIVLWILQTNKHAIVNVLVFGRSESEVFFTKEISGLKVACNGRFFYRVILSCPTVSWQGLTGKFSERNLRKHLPDPGSLYTLDDLEIFLSGRMTFINVTKQMLIEYGYPPEMPKPIFADQPLS